MTVDPFQFCSDARDSLIDSIEKFEETQAEMFLSMDEYLDAMGALQACVNAATIELSLAGGLTSDLWESILEEFLNDPDFSFQDCDTAVSDFAIAKQEFLEAHKNHRDAQANFNGEGREYLACLREAKFEAARR